MAVVALGASAGGLDALQRFFSKMPPDRDVAFVVVTHVQHDRQTLLPELLSRVTEMPVVAAEEGDRVEANKVIVASDWIMTLSDGVIQRLDADVAQTEGFRHHPIDQFFRALAEDQHERAVGVVLSGTANDGTLGLRAIKGAGGMVMVQAPESAQHRGMPDSALATGLVDHELPPEALPGALIEYCAGPLLAPEGSDRPALPDDAMHRILVRVRSHTGHDFTSYKKSTMSRRIARRMNAHHLREPEDYLDHVREHPEELDRLLRELLISVTRFFRDHDAFEALAEEAIPELIGARPDDEPLRVWVPGCATGEEAYSVAILLDEGIRRAESMHRVQIFATDLDERAIETGRAGLYPEAIAADVSPERLERYFHREDAAFRISKRVRDTIVFATQNVITDPPFTHLDLIVCRNLLIYLDVTAQRRVVPIFHYALRDPGFLFLGSSETPGEAGHLFETVDAAHRIFRRRAIPGVAHPAVAIPRAPPRQSRPTGAAPVRPPARDVQVVRSIERLLMTLFVPCAVLVDERGTVLYIHGPSGAYLQPEQGKPRNDILAMARDGLRPGLTTALGRARREREEVVRRGMRLGDDDAHTHVDVTVRPLTAPEALRGFLLVTFEPSAVPGAGEPEVRTEGPREQDGRAELERELAATRESLQSTVEELEASNEELRSAYEEMQSTNEEMQSANEELETSKEELQSLNEELSTVNAELETKVDALSEARDDMANLLDSMHIATVFLDRDLRVERYTQQATEIVRLIESDVGRPLADLATRLRYDRLLDDCRAVLDTLVPREEEVQDDAGRWLLVRVRPYRTTGDVVDGVVVSFIDIDRTRRAEIARAKAAAAKDFFESIVQTIRAPLVILDERLTVILINESFRRTFKTSREECEGRSIYDLGDGQWDIAPLRQLLEEILPRRTRLKSFRVEHDFPVIGRRAFLLNAQRLRQEMGERILLAFEDITEEA
ncbi:MAG: CheR family methyltransferase [Myxococcota bacterium]